MFTVLLSVYKKENPSFLDEALFSIYDAQKLKPNQIVLVQDGLLPPELDDVIFQWQEKLGGVLTVVPLQQNVGLGAALNEGLKHCKHDLVARMDTDDIALPERFERQVAFMQNNSNISASSAVLEEWNEELTHKISVRTLPLQPEEVARFAIRRSPLSHPLTIFRRSVVLQVGGYPPLRKAQDFALWSLLLSEGYLLANLPDTLLKMRTGNEMLDRRGWTYLKQELKLLRFQRDIRFLSLHDFIINASMKTVLRLSPNAIKTFAYKYFR